MNCGGDFITAVGDGVRISRLRFGSDESVVDSGLGMMLAGSDKVNELCPPSWGWENVAPIPNLRFALLTKAELADEVRQKLAQGEPLSTGTEYPLTLRHYLGYAAAIVWPGCSEGMIDFYGAGKINSVFGLIRSGETARKQGLIVVESDIAQVMLRRLFAPWADNLTLEQKLTQPTVVTAARATVARQAQDQALLNSMRC